MPHVLLRPRADRLAVGLDRPLVVLQCQRDRALGERGLVRKRVQIPRQGEIVVGLLRIRPESVKGPLDQPLREERRNQGHDENREQAMAVRLPVGCTLRSGIRSEGAAAAPSRASAGAVTAG